MLTNRARSVWAKSHVDPLNGAVLDGWLPLYQHLDDAAQTATLLWDHWAPRSVKQTLAKVFGSEASARALVIWLAGTHDVGKASPAFAIQVPRLADAMQASGLPIDGRIAEKTDRSKARHELVSYLAIRDWLIHHHDFDHANARNIASIAAAHHGNPPGQSLIRKIEAQAYFIGMGAWVETREELLTHADSQWADASDFSAWNSASITQPALVLLSSLVIVADWIASSDAFPPAPLNAHPDETADVRAARAWLELDFPKPWSASPLTTDVGALLTDRFDLPPNAIPRPTQVDFVNLALSVSQPELMILEAEMGSGKTEAALLAAEILASRFGLSGIFVGLPTRATADGMFGRVLSWAQRLGLTTPANIYLAHGTSSLNPEYAELAREAHFRSIGAQPFGDDGSQNPESIIAHRWFSAPRRGPLSSFVVGTVDQALFAGHRSRYLMLRHLALASKVVIIDEAHAYDDYMSTYLTRVLEWLGAYGVPVIMLSATLPSARRIEYHAVYVRGRDALHPTNAEQSTDAATDPLAGMIGYPVITATSASGGAKVLTPAASGDGKAVRLEQLPDDNEALLALLEEALRGGGNVAIVRNTVRRAQETAAFLRSHLTDIELTVAHSRFLAVDRAHKDRQLLERYGPKGMRPEKSIVVATQVIEQSLDVDFDLIVSDAAPVDLLLQRVGRLHRHVRDNRPLSLREPRLVITGVDHSQTPPLPEQGSRAVYGLPVLLRTLAVLRGRTHLAIPDDIAPLVEAVYGADSSDIPASWRTVYDEAERGQVIKRAELLRKSEEFAIQHIHAETVNLLGWLEGSGIDPELNAPGHGTVRDSDGETLEVIVLQRGEGGALFTPSWLSTRDGQKPQGGIQIPDNEAPDGDLTRTILSCKLRLPLGMCSGNAIDRHITALERSFELPHWHTSHWLKGELALVLDAEGRCRLNEFDIVYDADDGLRYTRHTA